MRIEILAVAAAMFLPISANAQPVTVRVDCASGRSINRILRNAPARPLIVELRGTCVENVRVRRHDVTLRGADPAADGVRATSSAIGSVAVDVDNARNIAVENLTLSGAHVGLRLEHAAQVRVSRSRLTGNRSWGGEVWTSAGAVIEDTTVDANQLGGLFVAGSVTCRRCTVRDNLDPDALRTDAVFVDGSVYALDSSFSGPVGVEIDSGGRANLVRTDVTGDRIAIVILPDGAGSQSGGTLDGRFDVDEGRLRLFGVVQTAGSANHVTHNGHVVFERWGAMDTTIARATELERFSNASASDARLGDLVCRSGADVWCTPGTVVTSSTCGQCPRP
jgi:hypothetical protein